MAKFFFNSAFDYRGIDLYSLFNNVNVASGYFLNNKYETYDKITYEDVLVVESTGSSPTISSFGGYGFAFSNLGSTNSDGQTALTDSSVVLAGTVTGYLHQTEENNSLVDNWGASGFRVSLKSIEEASQTTATDDDLTVLSTMLSGNDVVSLSDHGNVFKAYAGNDLIRGGSERDFIDGGAGADTMFGGLGHDKFWVDNSRDVVLEELYNTEVNSGPNRDEDNVVVSASSWTLTAGQYVENVIANGAIGSAIFGYTAPKSDAAINLTGNELNNTLFGNAANNRLDGGAGNDILLGSAGKDVLVGGKGNDQLAGGIGDDRLDGGDGDDFFAFDIDYAINFGEVSNASGILSLTGGTDVILGGGGIDTVGLGGAQSDYRFTIVNKTELKITSLRGSGEVAILKDIEQLAFNVTGDSDLDASLPSVDLARLLASTASSMNDKLQNPDPGEDWEIDGLGGNDTLMGGDANDTLIGNEGDDVLNGLGGNNQLAGGSGKDTFVVDYSDFYGTDTGIDNTLRDSSGKDLLKVTYNDLSGYDDLYANLRRTGVDGLNFSIGIRDGLQSISGQDGWLARTTIIDQFSLNGTSKFAVETLEMLLPDVLGSAYVSVNMDIKYASKGLQGVGTSSSDLMMGFGGGVALYGMVGNDYMSASRLDTSEELDTYNDRFSSGSELSLKNVQSLANAGLIKGDTLFGGAGNDELRGFYGNDRLDGGTGNDLMEGREGNDTYVVDSKGDVINETWSNGEDTGGIDTIEASIDFDLNNVDNIEHLTLIGKTNLNATGNTSDNLIVGNAGNNIIDGLGGADTLRGGAGNDTYVVDYLDFDGMQTDAVSLISDSSGNDTLKLYVDESPAFYKNAFYFNVRRAGENGHDLHAGIRSMDGNDDPWFTQTIVEDQYALSGTRYANAIDNFSGLIIDENGDSQTLNFNLALDKSSTETSLVGTNKHDLLMGFGGGNLITGNAGNDFIFGSRLDSQEEINVYLGRHGSSELSLGNVWRLGVSGQLQGDTLLGGDGNDRLESYFGNDTIFGGAGNDEIRGREGADVLNGGKGVDTFVYKSRFESTENARDTIQDFVSGTDKLDFSEFETDGDGELSFAATDPVSFGIWYETNGDKALLYVDASGDAAADMVIELLGITKLTMADFV